MYKQAGDSGSVQTTGADNDMRQYNTDAMETIMGSEHVILTAMSNSKSEDTSNTMPESPPGVCSGKGVRLLITGW